MDVLPVDLVALVSAIMGISIILFPVIGLTIRFALKPTAEALGRFFEHKGVDDSIQIMDRRMALMEQQIQTLESSITQLVEVTEFHNQLRASTREAVGSGPTVQEVGDKPVG
jgi:hypothetical protein